MSTHPVSGETAVDPLEVLRELAGLWEQEAATYFRSGMRGEGYTRADAKRSCAERLRAVLSAPLPDQEPEQWEAERSHHAKVVAAITDLLETGTAAMACHIRQLRSVSAFLASSPPVVERDAERVRHFKGGEYRVISAATIEATEERAVVYRSEGTGLTWVRTYADFTQLVEWPDGVTRPRFVPIEGATTQPSTDTHPDKQSVHPSTESTGTQEGEKR